MCIFFVFGSFSLFSLLQFAKCSVSCGTGIQVRKIDCISPVSLNASHTAKHLHRPNANGGAGGGSGVGNNDNDSNNNGKNGRIELLSDGQNVAATQLTGATISMGCDPKLKPIATQSCTPGIECTTIINANIGGEAGGGSDIDDNGSNEELNISNENENGNANGGENDERNEDNSNENEGETANENENVNQEENENSSTDIGESDADSNNGNDHSETDQTEVTEEDANVDDPKQPYEISVETENVGGEEEEEATASNENASVETDADAISEEVKELEVFTCFFWWIFKRLSFKMSITVIFINRYYLIDSFDFWFSFELEFHIALILLIFELGFTIFYY